MRLLLNRLLRTPRHSRCLAATFIAVFIIVLNAKVFRNSKEEDSGLPPVAQVDSASAVSSSTTAPFKSEIKIEPRAYDPWPAGRPLPCSPSPSNLFSPSVQRSPSNHGFLFVRLLKTGSASFLSAMIRMSQQIVKRHHPGASYSTCDMRVQHGWATDFDYSHRVIGKSFLYSLLRHPTDRAVSRFFYAQVSQKGVAPTDENFKNFLLWTHNNFYLQGLRLTKYDPNTRRHEEVVNEIIQNYDFIAITERMDESLVAMQMLLGLNTTDMIHFPVRFKGGYDHGSGPNNKCVFIQKSFLTPGMQEFFESDEWLQRSEGDYMLYKAANQSLDMTIDRLGRPAFEANLAHFRAAQVKAKEACQATLPCNEVGTYNPDHRCVYEDSGCDQDCLDRVAAGIDHPSTVTTLDTHNTVNNNNNNNNNNENNENNHVPPESSPASEEVKSVVSKEGSGSEAASTTEDGDQEEESDKNVKEESTKQTEVKTSTAHASSTTGTTHATPKKPAVTEDAVEEEEDAGEEEEQSKPVPKHATKKAPVVASDNDDEEEEKKPAKVSTTTKTTHKAATGPKVAKKSDDDEEGGNDEGGEEDVNKSSSSSSSKGGSKGSKATKTKTTADEDEAQTDDY